VTPDSIAGVICDDNGACKERIAELIRSEKSTKQIGRPICRVSSCRTDLHVGSKDGHTHFNILSALREGDVNTIICIAPTKQKSEERPETTGGVNNVIWISPTRKKNKESLEAPKMLPRLRSCLVFGFSTLCALFLAFVYLNMIQESSSPEIHPSYSTRHASMKVLRWHCTLEVLKYKWQMVPMMTKGQT